MAFHQDSVKNKELSGVFFDEEPIIRFVAKASTFPFVFLLNVLLDECKCPIALCTESMVAIHVQDRNAVNIIK